MTGPCRISAPMPPLSDRRRLLGLLAGGMALAAGLAGGAARAAAPVAQVWRAPSCGCCGAWMAHLRRAGLTVAEIAEEDLEPVKDRLGVPAALRACHSARIGPLVVEGHVPAAEILAALGDAAAGRIAGLAVPGMPVGSPGMEMGPRAEAYEVLAWGPAGTRVRARYLGPQRL